MDNLIYIRLDGDSIGDKIELALLKGNFQVAKQIHESIQKSIQEIKTKIEENKKYNILMNGCDDILFSVDKANYSIHFLEELMTDFYSLSNCTLSIGVGCSISETMHNLKIAKLSGKNMIIEY